MYIFLCFLKHLHGTRKKTIGWVGDPGKNSVAEFFYQSKEAISEKYTK